jgi:hypothetical protein
MVTNPTDQIQQASIRRSAHQLAEYQNTRKEHQKFVVFEPKRPNRPDKLKRPVLFPLIA